MNELSNCPYCEGNFVIREVACQGCETQIRGMFKSNRFHSFKQDDLLFIELFLKNEGNIKLMEKDLGISYPTVKNRLKNIVSILGYQAEENVNKQQRIEILNDISEGKLDVDAAIKRLRELK